jgi:hypothetical protein
LIYFVLWEVHKKNCAEEREQAQFNEVNQAERRRDKQRKFTNKQEQTNNSGIPIEIIGYIE